MQKRLHIESRSHTVDAGREARFAINGAGKSNHFQFGCLPQSTIRFFAVGK
jgi:hypothetical protein